jgi:protein-tyrosine phosphatase
MRFGLAFFVFGFVLSLQAVRLGGWWLLLLWPAGSFFFVAAAYVLARPGMLGKRANGRLAPQAIPLLAPYTALSWSIWHAHRLLRRGPVADEVAPGVWLGRRAAARELPHGVRTVVDFTVEFWEPAAVRKVARYVCVPTLDATASDDVAFLAALDCVATAERPVYIHCAQGFGRSAALAAALLVRLGTARDAAEAIATLSAMRPGVRLTARQRELVRRASAAVRPTPDPGPVTP